MIQDEINGANTNFMMLTYSILYSDSARIFQHKFSYKKSYS